MTVTGVTHQNLDLSTEACIVSTHGSSQSLEAKAAIYKDRFVVWGEHSVRTDLVETNLWQLTKTTEISGCRHFSCQQPVWVQFDRFDDSFRRITDKCQIGQEWAFLKRSLQAANPEVTNREILWVCGKIVVSCGQQQFTEWRTGGN